MWLDGAAGNGFIQVGGETTEFTSLAQLNIKVPKSGYVYIWVSNDSETPVYFDDLVINHRTGPLLQEDDYYAFGLDMRMAGSKASGKVKDKYKYNGKELQSGGFEDGSGLNWTDYGVRMYDNEIGRWNMIDPFSNKSYAQSPYTYCSNNPIALVDPDGETDYYFNNVGDLLGIKRNNSNIDVMYKVTNESQVTHLRWYRHFYFGWGMQTDVQKVSVVKSYYFANRYDTKTDFGTTREYERNFPSKVESGLKRSGRINTVDPEASNKPIGRWGDDNGRVWYVFNKTVIDPKGMLTSKELSNDVVLPTPSEGESADLPTGSFPANLGEVRSFPSTSWHPLTDANGNVVPYKFDNGSIRPGAGRNTYLPPQLPNNTADRRSCLGCYDVPLKPIDLRKILPPIK